MTRKFHPGQRPDAMFKRNAELAADYLSDKFTMAQLVGKYEISPTRIYELLKKAGVKK